MREYHKYYKRLTMEAFLISIIVGALILAIVIPLIAVTAMRFGLFSEFDVPSKAGFEWELFQARKAHKDLRDLLDYAKTDLTNLRDLANEIEKRMEKVRGML